MVSLFKDRSPAAIFWLFLLSIVVHSQFFVFPPSVQANNADGLISVFLNKYLVLFSAASAIFTYHAIVVLEALRLNHLFTDNRMYSRVNYLPAMVYILLTGFFTEWSNITPALIANSLVIWFFAKAMHLYNSPNPKTLVFNIGLLIGAGTILYHPLALLLPAAFFALMILRPFLITEWLLLIMGALAPFYFLASYLYLTDRFLLIKNYIPLWQFNLPQVHISIAFFITIAVIVIALVMGFFHWRQENRRLVIQIRNNWVVLLVMLLILIPVPFINPNAGIQSFILCVVPASPIIARGFMASKNNRLPALMFWIMILLVILKNWLIIK